MPTFPNDCPKTYRGELETFDYYDDGGNAHYTTTTLSETGEDAKNIIDPSEIERAIETYRDNLEAAFKKVSDPVRQVGRDEHDNPTQVLNGLNAGDSIIALADSIDTLASPLADQMSELIMPEAERIYHEKQEQFNHDAYDSLVAQGCTNIT